MVVQTWHHAVRRDVIKHIGRTMERVLVPWPAGKNLVVIAIVCRGCFRCEISRDLLDAFVVYARKNRGDAANRKQWKGDLERCLCYSNLRKCIWVTL